nr:GTPase HflX [Clostridia bacterium]
IEGIPFLLVDTVGFLQDLPHNLIEAFKSTLESAVNCDLALVVCDGSGDYETQLTTTLDTLKSLGCSSPYLVVMNKCDAVTDASVPKDFIRISAKTGAGLDELKARILKALADGFYSVKLLFPYSDMKEYGALRSFLFGEKAVYNDDGLTVTGTIDRKNLSKFSRFLAEIPRD